MRAWLDEHYLVVGWLCIIGLALGFGFTDTYVGCEPQRVIK